MATAWLALGANIGDPLSQLERAIVELAASPQITLKARSTIIVTAPWGKTDQPEFHNMVVAIETSLAPETLLETCLAIEARMGRQRLERWGPRLIDIDIVAYDRQVLSSTRLVIPHPYAHERDFVLIPLREIAPDVADWIVNLAGAHKDTPS
ncbi:MAG: 2-amino-4-hydroxy-6-hydroxymethyldihydropteridine diphosphokinase [Devosia sp.]|nr:2-amino-4-hydroxy-6-hydroxymethyldihydropteridine diphosphokinase [Devosia sp.]